jgi:serine protease Do
VRSFFVALTMTGAAFVAVSPLQPAVAQVKGLPDFTELVEQVGPSVVNIRTMEKVAARSPHGGMGDEDMLEFFRRFGLPMPNLPRQAPRQNRPQQEEEQPRMKSWLP